MLTSYEILNEHVKEFVKKFLIKDSSRGTSNNVSIIQK